MPQTKRRPLALKDVVERTDTRAGRAFDLAIQSLIVLSLVAFSFETLPRLDLRWRSALRVFEAFTVAVFTLEYLLRVIVADRKLRFIFSFYGLIDLAAIVPFYITLGAVDLRSARVFRLFRLIRVFKLARYSRAMRRLGRAVVSIKEELVLFVAACSFTVFVAAVGIYYFEHEVQPEAFGSVFHSLWWAVATLTTVGYGDVYPVTAGGRVFTSLILLVGMGTVAVPTGLLASALTKAAKEQDVEREVMV